MGTSSDKEAPIMGAVAYMVRDRGSRERGDVARECQDLVSILSALAVGKPTKS